MNRMDGGAPVEHDRENDTACTRTRDGYADRERAACAEVVANDGKRRQEREPEPEAHADRLREKDLCATRAVSIAWPGRLHQS